MEIPHRRSPDDEPVGPEREQLDNGELDSTGVVPQPEMLRQAIQDAIFDAEAAADGLIAPWGARAIARALADSTPTPEDTAQDAAGAPYGALHHFAVTARADPAAIRTEITAITSRTDDPDIRAWAPHLERFIDALPDTTNIPADAAAAPDNADASLLRETVGDVRAYLQEALAEHDARGEPISREVARVIATLLAPVCGENSAMTLFAVADLVRPAGLGRECRALAERSPTSEIGAWSRRLQQFLHTQQERPSADPAPPIRAKTPPRKPDDPDDPEEPDELDDGSIKGFPKGATSSEILAGYHSAFEAYLTLPGNDIDDPRVMVNCLTVFIGEFASITEVIDDLTEVHATIENLTEIARATDSAEFIRIAIDQEALEAYIRRTWDIVPHEGKLYVFTK